MVPWRGYSPAATAPGRVATSRGPFIRCTLVVPPGPREGARTVTSQGHPYSIFKRAIQRRNVLAAVAAARELPQLSLLDALHLTVLVARKDPARFPRVAARWLSRYLEEHPDATIEEAALAASCLAALPGTAHQEAAQTLRAMAERATKRRRERGVA
jgi:hypothetical protein